MPVQASTNEPSEGGQQPSPLSLIIEFISCAVLIKYQRRSLGDSVAESGHLRTFFPVSKCLTVTAR
jgi:hypothetical protein